MEHPTTRTTICICHMNLLCTPRFIEFPTRDSRVTDSAINYGRISRPDVRYLVFSSLHCVPWNLCSNDKIIDIDRLITCARVKDYWRVICVEMVPSSISSFKYAISSTTFDVAAPTKICKNRKILRIDFCKELRSTLFVLIFIVPYTCVWNKNKRWRFY